MPRLYQSFSIEQLERTFAQNRLRGDVLEQLLDELNRRTTRRSRRLMARVAEALADHSPNDEDDEDHAPASSGQAMPADISAPLLSGVSGDNHEPQTASVFSDTPPDDRRRPAQLVRIRAPGTTGLPTARVRALDRSLSLNVPADADLPAPYVEALDELIKEIRRTGAGQKRYELEKGQKSTESGSDHIYIFPFHEDADLFEDARVDVDVRGRQVKASVASMSEGRILLAIDEDFGPAIDKATLIIDATALLVALKERLESVVKGEISFNKLLANAVVGRGEIPNTEDAIPAIEPSERLNASQSTAFRYALRHSISYIWGPPGCGKTRMLAPLVRAAFEAGKRVLVCSNTNKAVDQVLFRICEELGIHHEAMQQGHVLRLGKITDDKLMRFADYVTLDGIVERLSADLHKRLREIEETIAGLDARTEVARKVLLLFEELDAASEDLAHHERKLAELAKQAEKSAQQLARDESDLQKFEDELAGRRGGRLFGLLRRKREDIERDVAKSRLGVQQSQASLVRHREAYDAGLSSLATVRRRRDDLIRATEGRDRQTAQKQVDGVENERSLLIAEQREIDAKLAEIRNAAVAGARIIGATCTKTYLSVKEIGQADLVVLDEASMVLLPTAWFVAGMAKERVAISGDFRQIPPIVTTSQQAIFDVIGNDVFTAAGLDARSADRMCMLDEQHRMDDRICQLLTQPMYDGLLRTASDRRSPRHPPLPAPLNEKLVIIDTSDLWPFESVNAFFSRFNLMHALLVRNLAWHLGRSGFLQDDTSLGICTPYAAQSRLIRQLLDGEGLVQVQVGTVHRFQGDERNAIILDVPESHGGWGLGQFIQGIPPDSVGAKLINVAISRSQEHVIVLANLTYLDGRLPSSSLLRDILHRMQMTGRVIAGNDVLALRPIERDLQGLLGVVELDDAADRLGLFNEGDFERAFETDVRAAKDSIVILSGFVTPNRVGKLGDLLRAKVAEGVEVRCITRPPHTNGSMDPVLGKQALDALEAVGCVVDCRERIHEKIIIVDRKVVWHGSLNALSHAHRSDEVMTRLVNQGFAGTVAASISKRRHGPEKALASLTEAENPRCGECGSRTVYATGRYGPYFYCESQCGWTENLERRGGGQTARRLARGNGAADATAEAPKCPDCGGDMRLRSGRYGEFYGCLSYPQCRGTIGARRVEVAD